MSSHKGVLVCQSCNESAARLGIVVASLSRVEAVRAVPPQEGPVLLFCLVIIVIMGRVRALPEVDACGSVESALSRGGADQSYVASMACRLNSPPPRRRRALRTRRWVRAIVRGLPHVPQQRHAP